MNKELRNGIRIVGYIIAGMAGVVAWAVGDPSGVLLALILTLMVK